MKKKKQSNVKRLFLAFMFLISLSSGNVAFAEIASGTSGGCTWTISDDGTLTIKPTNGTSGTLDAWGTAHSDVPWFNYKEQVTKVVVNASVIAKICRHMFREMSSCTEIDLSGLTTTDVTDFAYIFMDCSKLTTIKYGDNFDTSKGLEMNSMFNGCSSMTTIDVSKINTSSATNLGHLFAYCSSLVSIDISSLNTSNVKYFDNMFRNCSSLTSVNVNGLKTTSGTSFEGMFKYCSSLTKLDLSSFEIPAEANGDSLFARSTSLDSLVTPKTIDASVTTLVAPCVMRDCTKGTIIAIGGAIPVGGHLLICSYKPRTILEATLEDPTLKVGGYWGTFYTDIPVSVPSGVTVYYAIPYEKELDMVAFVKVSSDEVLPKGGYLINNTESVEQNRFVFQSSATVEIPETNVFKGDTTKIEDSEDGYYYYYLTKYQGTPGFFWQSGTKGKSITMDAYKCYLKVPKKYIEGEKSSTSSSAKSDFSYIFLNHEDLTEQTTGINSLQQTDNAAKDARATDGIIYDLHGRKVETMRQGAVYIKNGKIFINR